MPAFDERPETHPGSSGPRPWVRTARWLAAETTVVVVGILIAMALNSWWTQRQDDERARSYLIRIAEDLDQDADALEKRMDYFQNVQAFGDGAAAYWDSGTLRNGSYWHTVVAFFQASQIWPYVSTTRTYDEMQSAGDLRLIRSPDLRAALADYYDDSEVSQGGWIFGVIPEYRNRIRSITPIDVQRYLFESCAAQDSYENQVLLDCDAPETISEDEARAILEHYRASPELMEDLRSWMSNLMVTDIIMHLTSDAARRLAGQVREAEEGA